MTDYLPFHPLGGWDVGLTANGTKLGAGYQRTNPAGPLAWSCLWQFRLQVTLPWLRGQNEELASAVGQGCPHGQL